jgi:hypothetical protein
MQYSFRAFLIPKIGNHAKSSDVAIEFVVYDPTKPEEMAQYEKQVALIKERQIQVADQGLFRPKDVIEQVRKRTGADFKSSHHTNAWKLYKVRPKARVPQGCDVQYCQYSMAFRDFIYTELWVQRLCDAVIDYNEFERIRNYRDKGEQRL